MSKQALFINTENAEEYEKLKTDLCNYMCILRVSSFCRPADSLPKMDELYSSVRLSSENILLIGLSQYLALKGDETSLHIGWFKALTMSQNKMVVLCFQMEKTFKNIIATDLRMQNRIIFLGGYPSKRPTMTLFDFSLSTLSSANIKKGLKEYFEFQEDNCSEDSSLFSVKSENDFKNAMISIRSIQSAFELLTFTHMDLSDILREEYGTKSQWNYLLDALNRNGSFSSALKKELQLSDLSSITLDKWNDFDENKQWLLFIGIKIYGSPNTYLQNAAQKANTLQEFVRKVYRDILNINPLSNGFNNVYYQRKELVKKINSFDEIISFCKFADIKGKEKIYYLTDTNEIERNETITCLGTYEYTKKELLDILLLINPELSDYMANYFFKTPMLDQYFQDYKLQKITNRISPEFLKLVNEHAQKREFNYELPTRIEQYEKIDRTNASVYFVDALGVEFLGYILKKCDQLGLAAKVSICRSNLPTITSCNKEFLEGNEYSVKDLDKLKHDGEGDYDYQKSRFPIHIMKELEIIKDLLVKAKGKLRNNKKVIIVSDHGASRLVVINGKQYDFDVDSKGTHGGRCCAYSENIQQVEYATEENGYYVLASYDRFKGGRAASVETHGGATLEEVVVPIIELYPKNKQVDICFIEDCIAISFKKKAELKIFASESLSDPSVMIDDKFYVAEKIDTNKYLIKIHDIKKAGDYTAEIFDGNNKIESLTFKIKKEISAEKDLL